MTLDIVMPFYGRFDHFREAVESVIAQTSPDWRLIILDDVYPDVAPGEWVRSLRDPRITYIRNETNLRPSRNYNKGIGLARSEFVQIMGCDDVMLSGYVERMHQLISEFPQADVFQPGVSVIDENGRPTSPLADRAKSWYRFSGTGARAFSGQQLAASLLRGNWTYFPSLVWRTASLTATGFRTDLDVVQDLAKLFEIVKDGGALVLDDQLVFNYRRHSASVSSVTGPDGSKFRQERTLFHEAEQQSLSLGWTRAARIARHHFTSRLNALTELPGAVRSRNATGRRTLARHVLNWPYDAK